MSCTREETCPCVECVLLRIAVECADYDDEPSAEEWDRREAELARYEARREAEREMAAAEALGEWLDEQRDDYRDEPMGDYEEWSASEHHVSERITTREDLDRANWAWAAEHVEGFAEWMRERRSA